MVRELKKFYNTKTFLCSAFLFVVLFFVFSFLYISKNNTTLRSETGQTIRYKTKDELKNIIVQLENNFDGGSLSVTDEDREKIELYKYLYENDIKYDEFRLNTEINIYEKDRFGYSKFMTFVLIVLINVITLFVVIETFTRDFLSGVYKYLYTQNTKRSKIILNKALSIFSIVSIFTLVGILLIIIIRSNYSVNYKYVFSCEKELFKIDVNKYFIYSIIAIIFDIIINCFLYISLCLFSNKYLKNIVLGIIITLITTVIFQFIDIRVLSSLFANLSRNILYSHNNYEIALGISFKVVLAAAMAVLSLIYFNKKELK